MTLLTSGSVRNKAKSGCRSRQWNRCRSIMHQRCRLYRTTRTSLVGPTPTRGQPADTFWLFTNMAILAHRVLQTMMWSQYVGVSKQIKARSTEECIGAELNSWICRGLWRHDKLMFTWDLPGLTWELTICNTWVIWVEMISRSPLDSLLEVSTGKPV